MSLSSLEQHLVDQAGAAGARGDQLARRVAELEATVARLLEHYPLPEPPKRERKPKLRGVMERCPGIGAIPVNRKPWETVGACPVCGKGTRLTRTGQVRYHKRAV